MIDLENNENWAASVELLFTEINSYVQHLSLKGTITEKFHAQVFSGILKKWNVSFSKSGQKIHLSLGTKYPLAYQYESQAVLEVQNTIAVEVPTVK